MSDTILATYATRYGSTQEVAEKVATTLQEAGMEVETQPARKVQSVAGYRAVVLGAPLYIGHWLKDAQRFLSRHQEDLSQLPVAVFTLGPTGAGDENEWEGVQGQLDKELATYPWLKPVAVALFGGKYDPDNLRFPMNILAALPASPLHGAPANGLRDWDKIQTWASDLPAKL